MNINIEYEEFTFPHNLKTSVVCIHILRLNMCSLYFTHNDTNEQIYCILNNHLILSIYSSSVEEFLKLKPNNQITIKKKVVGNRITSVGQRVKVNPTTLTSPIQRINKNSDVRIISQNKCYVPITIKDENSDQQIVAQIDANELMPGGFLKIQSAVSNKNKQQKPHIVTTNFVGQLESKSIFTTASGHNVTIHQPSTTTSNMTQQQLMPPPPTPVQIIHLQPMNQETSGTDSSPTMLQLTTLQNVDSAIQPQPMPAKSGITIQRIKPDASSPKKPNTQQQTVKSSTPGRSPGRSLPTLHAIKSVSNVKTQPKTKLVKATATQPNKSAPLTSSKQLVKKTIPKPAVVATPPKPPTAAATSNAEDLPSCNVCDKVFKRKEHLNQHMKLHLGLRPFSCVEPGCNKSFSRKEHLMRHVVSHTGKKMFNCEYCQKMFSRKDNLNKHKR